MFLLARMDGPRSRDISGFSIGKLLQDSDVAVTFSRRPALVADHASRPAQIGFRLRKALVPSKMKIGSIMMWAAIPKVHRGGAQARGHSDQFRHDRDGLNLRGRG